MMVAPSLHLTVIAKEPIAGRVKTRLVPPLTHAQAADIARACLADTFAAVDAAADDDVRRVALIDGAPGDWIPDGYEIAMQRGDGLGERLRNGFEDLGPGVIIGMDTPSAGPLLTTALHSVREGRDVMGCTLDGGYWGIGLAAPSGVEFDGVPMSVGHTGQAQLDQLWWLGRTVDVLATVSDLDHFEDIAHIAAELPNSELARVAHNL